jgi:NADPH2:quinone reductase
MRAIYMTGCGGTEVLQLVTLPQPKIIQPTDLLIRVQAAGINPIDTKIRKHNLFYPNNLPAILGLDGAGIVESVGDQVTHFKLGDSVWYCHGGLGKEPGNYADYHIISENLAQFKPRTLDFIHTAAAPLVLITAWEALFDRARLQAGQTVLIHAGAGGVGHVAIQLAKLAGARVITTVSNAAKASFVRTLGADAVVNYQEQNWVEAVLDWTHGRGVDVALDTVGANVFAATIPIVAHYGNLVTILAPEQFDIKEARLRNLCLSLELMLTPMLRYLPEALAHHGEILQRCSEWIDADKLRIHVSKVFPLEQANKAHQLLEQGHTQGKLVLDLQLK